jgi:hypothetical protein
MHVDRSLLSLRPLLAVDAVTCAGMGVVLTFGSGPLAGWTELPPGLLRYAGIALIAIAVVIAAVAASRTLRPLAVRAIIAGNVLWVAASAAVLVPGWLAPNELGVAFIIAQALVLVVLIGLERGALRRSLPSPRPG